MDEKACGGGAGLAGFERSKSLFLTTKSSAISKRFNIEELYVIGPKKARKTAVKIITFLL
jgi:hypothetical protein